MLTYHQKPFLYLAPALPLPNNSPILAFALPHSILHIILMRAPPPQVLFSSVPNKMAPCKEYTKISEFFIASVKLPKITI